MEAIGSGRLIAEASVELIQEYAHVNLRRGVDRPRVLRQARRLTNMLRLHSFEVDHLPLALGMLEAHPRLGARDAIHAAAGISNGLTVIISTDRDFDGLGELRRVDPADSAAFEKLLD